MKKSLLLKIVSVILVVVGFVSSVNAQVTTSSMSGIIKDAKGALPGAGIKATHTPSGTVYSTSTNNDGRFNINTMRVGGPYVVEISYVGFATAKVTDVFLKLGDNYNLNYTLTDNSTTLGTVTVTGTSTRNRFVQEKTGASTSVSSRDLATLPTINRSITDFTRTTPQASGNNFGGRDGRYNNIQIDGANLNNNFGLNNDPLPGGGSMPISIDAYDQISINIAPYDVRQAGFTGANISAVTKSGTNSFKGTAYGLYRDQSFIGTKIKDADISSSIVDSKSKTYGFSLGGPIIKNKLFFFVNAEKEENLAPGVTFYPTGGQGAGTVSSTTVAQMQQVSNYLRTKFGYETGGYDNFPGFETNNHKILGKIDWNISNNHKLTLKYSDFKGTDDQSVNSTSVPNGGGFIPTGRTAALTRLPIGRLSVGSMAFENSMFNFLNTTKSGTLEFNSRFSSKVSNQFLATFTRNQATRQYDSVFPSIDIFDGTTGNNIVSAGMDPYTYNNDVINKVYSFTNNLSFYLGKHTLTTGLTYEFQEVGNMFMAASNSYYVFNSIDDLVNDRAPIYYAYTKSLIPGQSAVYSAQLKIGQAGAYIQDEWNVTDNAKFTFGLRADMPIYHEDPLNNPATSALNFYGSNGELRNYFTDKYPKSSVLLSPRFGFRFTNDDKSAVLRGGMGIFTGRIPFVYLTNIPTNTGMYQFGGNITNTATLANIKLNADPDAYTNLFPSTAGTTPNNNVVFVDRDFKFPKIFRVNLGLDKTLENGVMFTFDGMFTKDVNGVKMRNANARMANGVVYEGNLQRERIVGSNRLNSGITSAVVLENSDRGWASSLTGQVSKSFKKGFSGSVAYTFTIAKDLTGNPGNQAASVWNSNPNVGTSNSNELYMSQYAVPHRVVANLSYRIEYAKHLATTLSLFYEGAHQGRYSFIYNGDINGDGNNATDLMYIPRANEVRFQSYTSGGRTYTEADQKAAFEQFVASSPYLSKNRGKFAERNGALLPWFNRVDVRLLQDIFVQTGKDGVRRHTLQFSADVQNAANLINKNWGAYSRYIVNNPVSIQSIGADNRPIYRLGTVSTGGDLRNKAIEDNLTASSTYRIQLGLRYIF
ncbi:TonB-dependent receptor [Pedobacter helvus]|uniref:Carboxypeptidase regulatory-like domain-containing protein n=1 Tax=Pedobacter helvus TaxID=2563444 RepID=A0ABW9JIZ3_9SPHI|nr:carboxypeptidase regulatory-like domain-containing protein [Pedobacter ureilyticus]